MPPPWHACEGNPSCVHMHAHSSLQQMLHLIMHRALVSDHEARIEQVKLKAQQAALKERLQKALQIARAPQTAVDTATVADKAVRLLDMMLEVRSADVVII